MKVLFLDVDGVLNSKRWFEADRRRDGDYLGLRSVDPVAVEMILQVLAETDAMLVLSSTWRLVDDYVKALVDAGLPIADMTPVLSHSSNRGEEIATYLREHADVKTFAIVDDDADAGDCGLRPYHVRTKWETGLTAHDAAQLVRLLGLVQPAKLAEA